MGKKVGRIAEELEGNNDKNIFYEIMSIFKRRKERTCLVSSTFEYNLIGDKVLPEVLKLVS